MRFPWMCLLSLLAIATPASANSIRCNGSIVSIGASKIDLYGKCGEPTSREAHDELRTTFTGNPSQRTTGDKLVTVTAERWVYDRGPSSFVRTVLIENGKIVDIQEGGLGSAAGPTKAGAVGIARCDPLSAFNLGDTPEAVLARCGEPASRDSKRIDSTMGVPDGIPATTTLEVWSYNFGSTNFLRTLHFRDGKLIKIVTGGYGFGG